MQLALVKSQKITVIYSFLFQALNIVCTSLKVAVTVDTLSLKLCCSETSMLRCARCRFSLRKMSNSKILEKPVSKEMGL
jgi:predicted RNA-binding Zn-ribbon protein involved in translation (DUF1610 family)